MRGPDDLAERCRLDDGTIPIVVTATDARRGAMTPNRRPRNGDASDGQGRFAKGNPGGPGRLPRAREADYLCALREEVSLDDWRAIVRKAAEDARDGDAKAREWLWRYVLPAVPAALDLAIEALVHVDVEARGAVLAELARIEAEQQQAVAAGEVRFIGGPQQWR